MSTVCRKHTDHLDKMTKHEQRHENFEKQIDRDHQCMLQHDVVDQNSALLRLSVVNPGRSPANFET